MLAARRRRPTPATKRVGDASARTIGLSRRAGARKVEQRIGAERIVARFSRIRSRSIAFSRLVSFSLLPLLASRSANALYSVAELIIVGWPVDRLCVSQLSWPLAVTGGARSRSRGDSGCNSMATCFVRHFFLARARKDSLGGEFWRIVSAARDSYLGLERAAGSGDADADADADDVSGPANRD